VRAGRSYRVRVRFRHQGLDDPQLHLLLAVAWLRPDREHKHSPMDHVMHFRREGEWTVGEEVLTAP